MNQFYDNSLFVHRKILHEKALPIRLAQQFVFVSRWHYEYLVLTSLKDICFPCIVIKKKFTMPFFSNTSFNWWLFHSSLSDSKSPQVPRTLEYSSRFSTELWSEWS